MKRNCFCSGVTALLLIGNTYSFSGTAGEIPTNSPASWFISVGAGAQFPAWNSHITVNDNSDFPKARDRDRYTTSNHTEAVIAASTGRRWQSDSFWFPSYSLGILWHHFFKTRMNGTITQHSLPEITNYTFNWDISSNLVLASGKLNLFQYEIYSPYFSGGIGSSFNRATNYSERGLPAATRRESPGFANANTSQFAYQLGAGVDVQLSQKVIVSAGYSYQDLGPVTSRSGKDSWNNQSLNAGSYHSNELLVTLTYLFGK